MEDNLNGRRPQWKMTSIEDELNGRQPQLKTLSMEDDFNGRQPQWKTTSLEDGLNRRQPSQLCNELGPAQPQLVLCLLDLTISCSIFIIEVQNKTGSFEGGASS